MTRGEAAGDASTRPPRGRASAAAALRRCAPGSRCVAPTTVLTVHSLEDYAEVQGRPMKQAGDLRIVAFEVSFAEGDRTAIRCTAAGSPIGAPDEDDDGPCPACDQGTPTNLASRMERSR